MLLQAEMKLLHQHWREWMNSSDFERRILAIERELRDLKTAHSTTAVAKLYTATIRIEPESEKDNV